MAEHLLADIKLPTTLRAILVERLEVGFIEAVARGRRIARQSMRSRPRPRRVRLS
jgi:hypothetical protein